MNNDKDFIAECTRIIEYKLGWGTSTQWQQSDFEKLAGRIFEHTEVQLSVSTLKRIWGKVHYTSVPNLATLNALAQFAGFESWRAFSALQRATLQNTTLPGLPAAGEEEEWPVSTNKSQDKAADHAIPGKRSGWVAAGLIAFTVVLVAAFTSVLTNKNRDKTLFTGTLHFSSRPVTKGVPNTVVFEYDAGRSNADSIQIQQSWDPRLREKVDRNGHQYTTTYYYPGYYRAKLLLNDSVVKEHDLFIETDGWQGLIEQMPIPVYLNASQSRKALREGTIPQGLLPGNPLSKETPYISFFNVNRQQVVDGNHFRMEAVVKNTFDKGDGVCQLTEIILMCTMGAHVIPISIPGCVGELNLVIANKKIDGKHHDLSDFGPGFADWVKVIFTIQDGIAQIIINNKEVYREKLSRDVGNIIGTRLRFKGSGRLDHFALNSSK